MIYYGDKDQFNDSVTWHFAVAIAETFLREHEPDDRVALQAAWSEYADRLRDEGHITPLQRDELVLPELSVAEWLQALKESWETATAVAGE